MFMAHRLHPPPGVNIYAGAFLIPVGVMLYTAHGGLKATYIAAWGECLPPACLPASGFLIRTLNPADYSHCVKQLTPPRLRARPTPPAPHSCTALTPALLPPPPLPAPPGHMVVIYVALLTFTFLIYAAPNSNVGLGNINVVYDKLSRMAQYQ